MTVVVGALAVERSASEVTGLGFEGTVNLPEGLAASRRTTDRAIADLLIAVGAAGNEVAAAYRSGLDALGRIGELRREVDAIERPGDLANADVVDGVVGRYDTLVDGVLDAHTRAVLAIDDPEARRTGELALVAVRHGETTGRLTQAVLFHNLQGELDTPDAIAEVASLLARLEQERTELAALVSGHGHGEVVEASLHALDDAGLAELTQRVLSTGEVEFDAWLSAGEVTRAVSVDLVDELLASQEA